MSWLEALMAIYAQPDETTKATQETAAQRERRKAEERERMRWEDWLRETGDMQEQIRRRTHPDQ